MSIPIQDLSDKGRKQNKRLRYEVIVCHKPVEDTPDLMAKFRSYGDAYSFAHQVSQGNVYYYKILIRS